MNKGLRNTIAVIGVLVATVLLSGCWDVTSTEILTVPTLMAIGWHHHQYTITMETDSPELMSTPGSGSSTTTSPTWILKGHGASISQALLDTGLNVETGNPLTLAHLRVVVLGKSVLSPNRLPTILDHFARAPYLHRTFWILSTTGPATPIAEAENPIGPDPVNVLQRDLKIAKLHGNIVPHRFYRVIESVVNTPYEGLEIPTVMVRPAPNGKSGGQFRFQGAYIILHDRIIGHWSLHQVRTYALLHNDDPGLLLTVPISNSGYYVFRVLTSHTTVSWRHRSLRISNHCIVSLVEVTSPVGTVHTPPLPLAGMMAKQLATRITSLVRWTQNHRVDMLGAGVDASLRDPLWFPSHEKDWSDIYAQAPFTIHVSVTIHDTGSLNTY